MNQHDAGQKIQKSISKNSANHLDELEFFATLGSTNRYLLNRSMPESGRFRVVVADYQSAGHGRLGRCWHSPRSSGITLSLAYTFDRSPTDISSVTLATGVGLASALEGFGIKGIGLKWPNDLMVGNGKLGGILTEMSPKAGSNRTVIVGVGINYDLRKVKDPQNKSKWLSSARDVASCAESLPPRSRLYASLIDAMFNTLITFQCNGFKPFLTDWEKLDWLRGRQIVIENPDAHVSGICEGIEPSGALILRTHKGKQHIFSGSIILVKNRLFADAR